MPRNAEIKSKWIRLKPELAPSLLLAPAAAGGGGAASLANAATAAAAVAAAALLALLLWALRNARDARVPGPLELPGLGALQFLARWRGRILDGLLAQARERGPGTTWSIKWACERRYFMISKPELLRHVLSDVAAYPKGARVNSHLADLVGGGIFAVDGAAWRRQRQLFAHVFSQRSFREVVTAALALHGAQLERILGAAADAGTVIDASALMHRFTLDSIARIAFGEDVGALSAAEVAGAPDLPFMRAFDEAQACVDARFFTPLWELLRHVPFAMPSERRLEACLRDIDAFCLRLVRARRAAGDWAERRDVLSRAMAMVGEDGAALYGDDAASERALRDLVVSFLIAGRDTTAQALSWAVLLIAQHPHVEAALAAEGAACDASGAADKVAATPGAHAGAAAAAVFAPSHEAIQAQLPYARATACETLRLYPSVPKDVREAARDDVLPDGTRVPRGSLVAYLPYIMGRDDTLWSDAARFDPERFLADGEGAAASAWKFPAFNGSGPRQCMGQHLALTEASFVLALVYRRFSLELAPASQAGGALSHRDSLTLPQAAGVTVRVRRRGV